MSRKYLLLFATATLFTIMFLRIGYLYVEVGKKITENDSKFPSIFYGRPLEIQKGDHLGNIRLAERLNKLSYRKVGGKVSTAGTFLQDNKHILIFLRKEEIKKHVNEEGPVDITIRDGRVTALILPSGKQLESISLEPEEICRLNNTGHVSRYSVTLSAISPYMQKAVIASEDPRFYYHFGFDIPVIGCGTTITQQLAKDLFLTPRKIIARKLRVAELALAIEFRLSKNRYWKCILIKFI